MTRDEILHVPSMPAFSPSYPRGPYRFLRREYLIITYETDAEALRRALPEPLEPHPENLVYYEWMKMPDSSGFGDYEESGSGAIATYNGEACNFSIQMYLDDEPPITAGREIWGFPKKWGVPRLKVTKDTLTGTLHYDEERVAMGTMTYKHKSLEKELDTVKAGLGRLNVNLKLLPDVTGAPKVAQLVGYRLEDITVHGAWDGEARLDLIPHVNCRVADLPVKRIVGGRHMIVDFTLPYGQVLHDYLA
ncbi:MULTISPECIES: acetoacetate decarboxylase [Methylobacterium]|uniref:Acetoacetate decarboxylase n=1 Tax=Methylobacterium bullatum TaxID=570505 RepID=A0A679JX22_9HYPH|nr:MULTISPECIES: acetoacetate decarboxylase [Methylobacterium]KQO54572.1 acetoacetate decarboxylase [Methylobacterium sp. Leaf85]KQP41700.1 acetoacetate decarboxylase [Methylobacterium sp. Leaf106]MBD8904267.1 acetoacetate decarboxylase [Methylobacterium bullatum]TXN27320.1 acetoacetate decarboxylase [Methylobacterium sp. WL19]CAA2136540.1 putative acetoacetate decarboxylase [Methylobacterium bullatum]